MGKYKAINILEKYKNVPDLWSPGIIARINDQDCKIARIEGEFIWHKHDDSDEAFVVMKGEMDLEFRDGRVHLSEGDMFVVPKSVEHRPVANKECWILMIESSGTSNTGNIRNQRTKDSLINLQS